MLVQCECTCGALLNIETDEDYDQSAWSLTFRFANAHTRCGFVTPGHSEEAFEIPVKKRAIKPRRIHKEGEE